MNKFFSIIAYLPFIIMLFLTMIVYWICSLTRLVVLIFTKKCKSPFKTWFGDNIYATQSIFNEVF